ncbi:MAG: hypothetical protein ACSHWY_03995 [Octadecabacter sp.]
MRRLICVFWILASGTQAAPLDPYRSAFYVAFADAASGGDPEVMELARKYVAMPPTQDEDIGFYGLSDAPAPERALRAILTALVDNGYILDLEVQYLMADFEASLASAGAIGPTTNAPDLMSVIPDGNWDGPAFQVDAMNALAGAIGPFARTIEAEAAERDRAILQISVPFGDAVFFWVTTPEIAAEWRCVSLWFGPDIWRPGQTVDIGLSSVDWPLFYDLIRIEPTGGGAVDPILLDVPVSDCPAPQV